MPKALLTRPAEDAPDLAAALAVRGVQSLIAPVMRIAPTEATLPSLDDVQAVLLTSANGARALARATHLRDLVIIGVGAATAAAARAAGFVAVESAEGDVAALARHVAESRTPEAGRLLHVAGSDTAGDLSGDLAKAGFTVERVVLYRAEPVESLSDAAIAAIRAGEIDYLPLFSPRTAGLVSRLAREAGVAAGLERTVALCLSPAVAAALTLPVAAKRIALKPDQEALMALLDQEDPLEPPATSASKPSPPMPRRSGALRGIVALLAVLVLALIGWNAYRFREDSAGAALAPRVAAIEAKLAAPPSAPPLQPLERRIAALEEALAKLSASPAAVPTAAAEGAGAEAAENLARRLSHELEDKLDQRLGAFEQLAKTRDEHVQSLEQSVRASADARTVADLAQREVQTTQTVEELRTRVGKAEEGAAAGVAHAGRRAALALAVGALATAEATGRPFEEQWRTLAGLVHAPEPGASPPAEGSAEARLAALATIVAVLKPLAQSGAPTLAALRRAFPETALKIARADQAGDEAGWLGEVKRLATGLVTVRRTDRTADDAVDGLLARAERALEDGDPPAALAALKPLTGAPGAAAAPFIAKLESRIAVERALETLSGRAIEDLAERAS